MRLVNWLHCFDIDSTPGDNIRKCSQFLIYKLKIL